MDMDQVVETETEVEPDRAPTRRRVRVPSWVAWLAVAAAFFGLCLAASLPNPWNGDTATTSLQGYWLVHGHLMLHGYWSSDVNFYTLDAPLYGLCLVVFGVGSTALYIAGALLYTFVFLAAAWLAVGYERGARAWLRVALVALMLTGPLFHGALISTLVQVPDHCGTVIFALVSFTLVNRFPERRWAPWALLVVLILGQLGDATVRYVAVPALLVVWFIDTLIERRVRTRRHWFALAAAASVPLEMALRRIMKHYGAYYLTPPKTQIAPRSAWGWHLHSTWESMVALFGVHSDIGSMSAGEAATSVFGGFALLCGIGSVLYALARWTKVDVADRLLATASVVYLAAYAFSTVTLPGAGGGYEFVGVVALFGTLAARTLPRLRWPGHSFEAASRERIVRGATAAAAVGAAACLVSGTALFVTPQTSPIRNVAGWLRQHNLTYGLAGYWNAGPTTIYSGNHVQVRQIVLVPNGFLPYAWGSMQQWYDPTLHDANFIIASDGPAYTSVTVAGAEACFGKPASTYEYGGLTVLIYPYNLLTKGITLHLPPGV